MVQVDLSFRRRKILYAAITEYISRGEPVGSRTLAKSYQLDLSPATIRNVLSDLEDAGFLTQPHTSAGRVPTEAGFRLFVDALVKERGVSEKDRRIVISKLSECKTHDALMKEAGKLLSTMTGAAGIVTAPRPEEERLAQLRFMPMRKGQVVAILITESGAIQNRAVSFEPTPTDAELERLNNYLAEVVENRTLRDVHTQLERETADERSRYSEIEQRAKAILQAMQDTTNPTEMLIEGQSALFDRPEFLDVDKLRGYLRTFEDKERLVQLLEHTLTAAGVRVVIGSEANLSDVQDISLITTGYSRSGVSGTLGVIGPTRIDYGKVVPLVGFTASVMSDLLSQKGEIGDDSD